MYLGKGPPMAQMKSRLVEPRIRIGPRYGTCSLVRGVAEWVELRHIPPKPSRSTAPA